MSKVKRQFIDSKCGQIHLRVAQPEVGEQEQKTPLICLHMVPKSGRNYHNIMPELARSRLVIAPDYPGYGESDHYPEDYLPSISDYAEAILEVIEHFNLQQVDLLGYHTGCMVSVEIASRCPQLVRKLINISAPVLTDQEAADFKEYFKPVPLDEEGTRFRQGWERIMHYRGPGMTLEMAAVAMAENLRAGSRYEDGHYAAFDYAAAYKQKLGEIEQPVWVMNLQDDLNEHSSRVDAYLKNGYRTDFNDWGTCFLDIWPKEAAAEILNFLDS